MYNSLRKILMTQLYCQSDDKTKHVWKIDRIWELAKSLETIEINIEDIIGLDSVTWFSNQNEATIRSIANHAQRIYEADLSYPPILTEDNRVFDGMHRIAKHLIDKKETILVKKFLKNPEPDEIIQL